MCKIFLAKVNQMDKLISAFKIHNPDFVTEYDSNREIIDPPIKPRKPKTTVNKKDDDKPK